MVLARAGVNLGARRLCAAPLFAPNWHGAALAGSRRYRARPDPRSKSRPICGSYQRTRIW